MTRKDYIRFAHVISRIDEATVCLLTDTIRRETEGDMKARRLRQFLCVLVGQILAEDNSRFDWSRFETACHKQ